MPATTASDAGTADDEPPFVIIKSISPYRRFGETIEKTSTEGNRFQIMASYQCSRSHDVETIKLTMFGHSSKMCGYAEIRIDGHEIEARFGERVAGAPYCEHPCRSTTIFFSAERSPEILAAEQVDAVICLDTVSLSKAERRRLLDDTACRGY